MDYKTKIMKEEGNMLEYEVRAKIALWRMKNEVGEKVKAFFTDESGDTNFISIIVVLVIVLALAVVFRKNIASLVNGMWSQIMGDATKATGGSFETSSMTGELGGGK